MRHLNVYEDFDPAYNNEYNPSDYKILTPGQILHYRQVFRLMPARDAEYVLKVLNTIERKGGKTSLKQWNVIQKKYRGEKYTPNY